MLRIKFRAIKNCLVAQTERWLTSYLVVLKYLTDKYEDSQAGKKWVCDEKQWISAVLDFVGPFWQTFNWTPTTHALWHQCRQTERQWKSGHIACMLGLVKWTHWHWRQSPNILYHGEQLDFQERDSIISTLPQCAAAGSTARLCFCSSHNVAFFWPGINISLPLGDVCVPPACSASSGEVWGDSSFLTKNVNCVLWWYGLGFYRAVFPGS